MAEKTLDEQVNDLAKHFARLIYIKDFDINNLNTSEKLRLKCIGEYNRLINKIDGIVETWVQAKYWADRDWADRRGSCGSCGFFACKC